MRDERYLYFFFTSELRVWILRVQYSFFIYFLSLFLYTRFYEINYLSVWVIHPCWTGSVIDTKLIKREPRTNVLYGFLWRHVHDCDSNVTGTMQTQQSHFNTIESPPIFFFSDKIYEQKRQVRSVPAWPSRHFKAEWFLSFWSFSTV